MFVILNLYFVTYSYLTVAGYVPSSVTSSFNACGGTTSKPKQHIHCLVSFLINKHNLVWKQRDLLLSWEAFCVDLSCYPAKIKSKLKRKQSLGSPCVFLPHHVLFCQLTIELFYIVYKLGCVFGNPLSLFQCFLYVRRQ